MGGNDAVCGKKGDGRAGDRGKTAEAAKSAHRFQDLRNRLLPGNRSLLTTNRRPFAATGLWLCAAIQLGEIV